MSDKTNQLIEGDFFRFKKILVVAVSSDPRGDLRKRSGEHRGQLTKHKDGKCFIDQQYDVVRPNNN